MTHKLYPRLAWQGITKNKRLYLPFLLTCVGMVTMTYILLSLASSPILRTFPGGDTMPMILGMGSFVMAAFAVLFLFYTNSFLIRRRNREFVLQHSRHGQGESGKGSGMGNGHHGAHFHRGRRGAGHCTRKAL